MPGWQYHWTWGQTKCSFDEGSILGCVTDPLGSLPQVTSGNVSITSCPGSCLLTVIDFRLHRSKPLLGTSEKPALNPSEALSLTCFALTAKLPFLSFSLSVCHTCHRSEDVESHPHTCSEAKLMFAKHEDPQLYKFTVFLITRSFFGCRPVKRVQKDGVGRCTLREMDTSAEFSPAASFILVSAVPLVACYTS